MNNFIIVKMLFGSKLYGLSTKNSDIDYKGVYLPSVKNFLSNPTNINTISNNTNKFNKNSSHDIDEDYFHLHKFINRTCNGDLVNFDMLFASRDAYVESSFIWLDIIKNKEKFYSKYAFNKQLSFIKSVICQPLQIKEEIDALKAFIEYMEFMLTHKLMDPNESIMLATSINIESLPESLQNKYHNLESDLLEKNKNNKYIENIIHNNKDKFMHLKLKVCNKSFNSSILLSELQKEVKKLLNEKEISFQTLYDESRCKQLHHAYRIACQLINILTNKEFTYPLKENDYILDIKLNRMPTYVILNALQEYYDKIKTLIINSKYPDEIQKEFWDNFLYKTMLKYIKEVE